MKLPLRARITAWYFAVLLVSFASFAWLSDYGFRRSIETTVNLASQADLESLQVALARAVPKGPEEVSRELHQLAGLWADGSLLEVADSRGNLIYQSSPFRNPYPAISVPVGPEVSFLTVNLDDVQYRLAMRSVSAGENSYRLRVAVPTEPFDQALDRFRLILKETLPALVILASLIGYWLSGRALSPVDGIIKTARGIGVQDLSGRLAVPEPHDELRRLSETLNDMLARIESSVKRITQFTADASHDLRTPLALIRASAELALRRERTAAEYRESLAHILAASEETSRLIENLLTLARADAGAAELKFRRIDLVPLIKKAAEQASILAEARNLRITTLLPSAPVTLLADSAALDRLFLLLLENAVKYTPGAGRIDIRLENGQETARLEIRDSGIGIPEKDLPHIFERFYRADQARSRDPGGSGLGLAIARWIVEAHRGSIHAQSILGEGSSFHVSLPIASNS